MRSTSLLHDRAPQRAAGCRLDLLLLELIVLDLAVAFEGEPLDERVFHHRDEQSRAGTGDAHVLEQAGGVERLQGAIELRGIGRLALPGMEVRADRICFDALVALDPDGRLRLRVGGAGRRNQPADHDVSREEDAGAPAIGAKGQFHAVHLLLFARHAPVADAGRMLSPNRRQRPPCRSGFQTWDWAKECRVALDGGALLRPPGAE